MKKEKTFKNTSFDALNVYLKEIEQYSLLTVEEEQELAKLLQSGDEQLVARSAAALVNSNLRLVVSVAREYAGRGVPLLDLIQEGSMGLLEILPRFRRMGLAEALEAAVQSMVGQLASGGLFVASIRDYDALLESKPPYSPPYIHKTDKGRRVSFQTWDWEGEHYKLVQYIIDDEGALQVSKFACEYRATRREELTQLLYAAGCREVVWKLPEETGFYQPIVVARK